MNNETFLMIAEKVGETRFESFDSFDSWITKYVETLGEHSRDEWDSVVITSIDTEGVDVQCEDLCGKYCCNQDFRRYTIPWNQIKEGDQYDT